ncbi:MAG: PAS domain S-box protein [Dehalococcoidales bacterium]|nr:PAS domain S-box protein [Dehalococcoidales bacterium]
MLFSITSDWVLSFITIIVSVILAAIVWTRRPAPGAFPFSFLMLTIAVWIIIRTLVIAAVDFEVKLFLAKILIFTTTAAGIMWLSFALDYTGSKWWTRTRNVLLLLIIPCITLFTVLFGKQLNWDWLVMQPVVRTSETLIVWSRNPIFWLQGLYILSIFITGIVILWRFVFLNLDLKRMNTIAILTGAVLPIISHSLMVSGFYPSGVMDVTPYLLLVMGVIYTLVIFRYKYIDVVPEARITLVENIPDSILVLDDKNSIIDINPAATKIIGREKSSALGERIDAVWPELERIVSQTDWGKNKETFLDTTEGKVYVDISLTQIRTQQGLVTGKLIVLRDITERQLTRQKLEVLYEEERQLTSNLQDEIEKRKTYTKAIVHELNTPLTSILAASELLESEVKEKRLIALAGNVRRSSLYLAQRIVDLIELARGETGSLEIYTEPLDISKLVHEVIDEVKKDADDKGISILSDIPELLMVSGDRNRLRQVLMNLIGNATRYTDKGHVIVKAGMHDHAAILVQVEDTGPGIDEDKMENLFDPYKRNGNEGEELGGIGIGLALSKIFVELHDGKIWAESIPGEGSYFYFTIPCSKDI